MKKILVIDGNSIINRAFYGVKPLTTKSGKNTNAIFGMINIISRQLDLLKPDYAAVAFDLKAPTFRHKMFADYKAGRKPTPEELREQFPDAKKCLALMGLHVLELPGYEADDIQGTVAHMAYSSQDTESYILTGDRDLLQLIDGKITVLLATNGDTLTMHRDEFFAKYGVEPSVFVEMKALMGDSSDNIPGVPGIGEKTAQALISKFGTLEALYEGINDESIKKGAREKLINGRESAFLSRELARIDTKAPLELQLCDLEYRGIDKTGLYKKFTELELNSFIAKFGLNKTEEEKHEELKHESATFKELDAEGIEALKTERRLALYSSEDGYYIYNDKVGNCVFKGDAAALGALISGKEIICYGAKALWHAFDRAGFTFTDDTVFLDLSLYAYVLNPGSGEAGIPALVSMFLSIATDDGVPCPELLSKLEAAMRKRIDEDGLTRVLDELEIPLINILAEIEKTGFKINIAAMNEYADALAELEGELAERIYIQAGKSFNINSPKQLGEVLFVDMALPYPKKKSKSSYSTDAETLEAVRPYSPIIDDILEYRQVAKLRGTYAATLPKIADENDRIHTDFRQALTATGRLSSQEPNLQNIPIRTKMGREMRRSFVAKDGYTLVDADYSQIELRLLAHISDDYNMRESFISGADIHRKTAAAVFGVPEESVSPEMRKRAKAVNFGIIYGIGGFSLAKDIGTTTQEASRYIKNYLMNYPSIDTYLTDVVEEAKERGYTHTLMGRRRYIPELNASNGMLRAFGKRVAMNAPIQGTAADIMKLAMIKVYRALKAAELDARIVMQVHDELVIEARDDQREICMEIVKREMESAEKLSLPLTVDVTSGKNWLEQE